MLIYIISKSIYFKMNCEFKYSVILIYLWWLSSLWISYDNIVWFIAYVSVWVSSSILSKSSCLFLFHWLDAKARIWSHHRVKCFSQIIPCSSRANKYHVMCTRRSMWTVYPTTDSKQSLYYPGRLFPPVVNFLVVHNRDIYLLEYIDLLCQVLSNEIH